MYSSRFSKVQKSKRRKAYAYKRLGKYSSRHHSSHRGRVAKQSKKKKIIKRVVGVTFIIIFFSIVAAGIGGMAVVAKYTKSVPTEEAIRAKYTDQWTNSSIYDRNGRLLFEARGPDQTREYVKYEDIPPQVKWMIIAAEDEGFYDHKGFDYLGLSKAGVCYITREITKNSGKSCAGASTLTQQLMKNWFFSSEKSLKRKLEEAIVTMRTEQTFSKDELLEAYVNTTSYGGTIVGIKTAAKTYFNKDLDDLTLGEAAVLAAVPNQPGNFSVPFSSDPDKARELVESRKNDYILNQFAKVLDKVNAEIDDEDKKYTMEDIEAAKKEVVAYKRGDIRDRKAPHFVNYVMDILREEPFKFSEEEISGGGYKIYTSLDLDIQEIAEEEIAKGVAGNIKAGHGLYNASLITINPNNGEILAYVGSKNFYGERELCHKEGGVQRCKFDPQVDTVRARNAAGSSLKPMVSLTGFEQGTLNPASFIPDIPIELGNYKPTNYDGKYWGLMKLRYALLYSRNVPFIQAVEVVGVGNFLDKLEQFGYSIPGERSNYGPAVALGAVDIRLLDHTYGYTVLANGGRKVPRTAILKIEDKDGNVVYESNKNPDGERVADEKAVYLVNHILGDRNYLNFNYRLKFINEGYWGGKTGTSDGHKDTWFIGYSPEVVTGVWSGNNDNSDGSVYASGVPTAMPIWHNYMVRIADRFPKTQLKRPGGIVNRTVCSDSGLLATDETPCKKENEVFISDKLPKEDDEHKVLKVCKDQPDRLARPIDEQMGFAEERSFTYLRMLKEEWQPFLDKFLKTEGDAIPTEECNVSRNPSGSNKPWVIFEKPTDGQKVTDDSVDVKAKGYSSANVVRMDLYFGSELIETTENDYIEKTIDIDPSYDDGTYPIKIVIYDSSNKHSEGSVSIDLDRQEDVVIDLISPINGANWDRTASPIGTLRVKVVSGGDAINSVKFYVSGRDNNNEGDEYTCDGTKQADLYYYCNWNENPDPKPGTYQVYAVAETNSGSVTSNTSMIVLY